MLLAIETSCDETACALLNEDTVVAEIVYSQTEHALYGGVVPELAARDHQVRLPLLLQSMMHGICQFSDISHIAYTQGPGLAGCLWVGHYYAVGLATGLNIPIRGIHHLEGHIMSVLLQGQGVWMERYKKMTPCIALIVSGGHTMFVEVQQQSYKVLGETLDDAVGEVFDKIARLLSLPYPGGAALSKLAASGKAIYALPRPMTDKLSANMSFSGLKTAARLLFEKLPDGCQADFAASFEQAVIDTLMYKIKYVMHSSQLKTFIIVGGVSANTRLRSAVEVWSYIENITCIFPPQAYCGDNAAMIAVAGWLRNDFQTPYSPATVCLRDSLKWL